MGIGTTEALPINRMLERVSGITGTKAIYKSLIMAGREGLEEAFQEILQQGAGDVVAKWIAKYDTDRSIMQEWQNAAAVGGTTGAIFSILTSSVGGWRGRNRLTKTGIDLDKIPEVDAKIRSGEALNESEAALARSAGVEVDDKGFVVLPETETEIDTEEVAATAYSGGKEEAIIALAQKEAEEGFTREVEEEYNKLIGIRGTSEEDVLARELYDKTKFKAQSDVDAKRAEDETNEFLDNLGKKIEDYVLGKGEKLTDEELESYVIKLAQRCGKHISVADPLLDATLMDGSRIVMKLGREVSTRGSAFCIRRFKDDPFSPCDIIAFRTLSSLMGAYLWVAFQNEVPLLFVGGTASGKTTTLNAMCIFIPWQMKIVSIESTREVNIPQPNWVPGLTRQGFGGESNEGEIGEFELLKAALRERPEYIIVGEIRGAEAYVLFQAMATGHCAYSTVHADSVASLVHRLENKPIDIPRVLLPALEGCCIQIQTRINGRRVRRTKQIVEIVGIDPNSMEIITNEVFRWNVTNDDFIFSGKSYVLEKIMVKINYSQDEMRRELRTRKRILEWMVLNDILSLIHI